MNSKLTKKIDAIKEEHKASIAEQFTGCIEGPKLEVFNSNNDKVSYKKAKDELFTGNTISIPEAGAGTYYKFLKSTGAKEVKLMESTSSAGDWLIGANYGGVWYPVFQSNRFPRLGFSYTLSVLDGVDSFEALCERCSF